MEKNTNETKTCKYCQSEIPKKAKICPVCKKKQGRGGCLVVVIVVIVLILIASVAGGGGDDKPAASLVSSETDSQASVEPEAEGTTAEAEESSIAAESETEPSNRFVVGDVVETDSLRISFVSAGVYTSDNQFIQPKDGYEYWRFEFAFENISDRDQSISSMVNWECYADNSKVDQTWIGDESGLDATLSPGRQTQGAIYFEVPVDAQSLELEYDINFWKQDKIVFIGK